jgi:aminopeptidase YwaD
MIKLNHVLLIFSLGLFCFESALAQSDLNHSAVQTRLYHDVFILASDSLQGREAGTAGEKMASDYISKQMQTMGLLPKGDSRDSFLSEFRMNFPVVFKNTMLKVNDISFKAVEEFGATDMSSSGNITAPLINIGKGIAGSDYDAFGGNTVSDVRGQIVVIDIDGDTKDDKNELLEDIIARVKSVVQKGAVGIILHNSSRKATEDVLFGSPFTASLAVPVVYVARLPFNKISKIKSATCSLSVEIDRNVSKPANVVGWINNKSAKTVVIGAHYDHLGMKKAKGSSDKTPQVYNGADDNASGTAAMLELARWAAQNNSLRYNYVFAAFSAEEEGLFGSKAFASRKWVNNDNIIYMLNMDMVGRLGCEGDTISILGVASSTVWETTLDSILHPDFSIKKIYGAPAFSDHSPFLKKDIPVIFFTTGLHPDYHTPKDDTELINFKGMTELLGYLENFIRSAEALPGIPFHKVNALQNARAYIQTFN